MKPNELLKEIISKYGPEICLNRDKCKGIISDYFKNSHKREKNLLNIILDERIVEELITNPKSMDGNVHRYAHKIFQERGIHSSLTHWAIYAWAYALSIKDDSEMEMIEEIIAYESSGDSLLVHNLSWQDKKDFLAYVRWAEGYIADCDRSLQENPTGPAVSAIWCNKGARFNGLGRYFEANTAFDIAIGIYPGFVDAWQKKIFALIKLERYQDVISACDRVIQLNPNSSDEWFKKGFALERLERYEEAITSYNRAIELWENSADAWINKGSTLERLKRYEESIVAYEKVIQISAAWNKDLQITPRMANVWAKMGSILNLLGKYKESIVACDKAIQIDPKNPTAWVGKGIALQGLGRHKEAYDAQKKANILCYQKAYWYNIGLTPNERFRYI